MVKDYRDVENTTIAEYKEALYNAEQKILTALKEKDFRAARLYTKVYFKLNKYLNKKSHWIQKKNNTKSR